MGEGLWLVGDCNWSVWDEVAEREEVEEVLCGGVLLLIYDGGGGGDVGHVCFMVDDFCGGGSDIGGVSVGFPPPPAQSDHITYPWPPDRFLASPARTVEECGGEGTAVGG